MSNADEPAFPQSQDIYGGLTKLEHAAIEIMKGFCANPAVYAQNGMTGWYLVNITETQLDAMVIEKARALLAALATEMPSKHADLLKFYSVETLDALVEAQSHHIEKLQAKLGSPTPGYRTPREG